MNDDKAAYEQVRRGYAWAALVIQPNYTNALVERVEDGRYAEDSTVEASDLGVRMDWSSKYINCIFKNSINWVYIFEYNEWFFLYSW